MGLAVSLVAFLRSEDYRTLPRDKRVRSPADGFSRVFRVVRPIQPVAPQNSCSHRRCLLSSKPRIEASLRDRLHRCRLQGLSRSV
jgi:hypothetical protein